jgi:hypothetical protein
MIKRLLIVLAVAIGLSSFTGNSKPEPLWYCYAPINYGANGIRESNMLAAISAPNHKEADRIFRLFLNRIIGKYRLKNAEINNRLYTVIQIAKPFLITDDDFSRVTVNWSEMGK